MNYDVSASCPGAVTTPGLGLSAGGAVPTGSFPYSTPDANTLQEVFGGTTWAYTRFAPK